MKEYLYKYVSMETDETKNFSKITLTKGKDDLEDATVFINWSLRDGENEETPDSYILLIQRAYIGLNLIKSECDVVFDIDNKEAKLLVCEDGENPIQIS